MEENKNEEIVEETKAEEPSMVTPVEENPKKKKGSAVVVVILLVVVFLLGIGIGAGVFILSGKKPATKQTETKEEHKTKKDTDEKETETKEDVIKELTEGDIAKYKDSITNLNRFLPNQYPFEATKLENKKVLRTAWDYATWYESRIIGTDQDFSKEQMKEFVSHIFGENYVYQDENIPCFDGDIFEFRDNTYHKVGIHGHGGNGYTYKDYFVSAKFNETKGLLEINEKVIYGETRMGESASEYVYTTAVNGKVLYKGPFSMNTFGQVYEQHKDEIPVTTYVYKVENDGTFALQSIKVQ